MKILLFTENTHRGGLDTFLANLINHWPHPEDELMLAINASHPGIEGIRAALTRPCDIQAHHIPTYLDLVLRTRHHRVLRYLRKIFSPLLRYAMYPFYISRLRQEFVSLKPDRLMVVNGGHPGADICRAAPMAWESIAAGRPRAIYNFHSLASGVSWFERLPEWLIDRLVARYSKAIIGVSRACAESLRYRMGSKGMSKAVWIYNGIPEPRHIPAAEGAFRKEIGIGPEGPLCLMLGTYEPLKGHDFLLRALKRLTVAFPSIHLVMCGYGYPDEMDVVDRLVDAYGLRKNCTMQGFRSDVDAMLQQSDLLLVSSQAYESFSLVSVEAMANRVPVVATRIGGIPEVIKDGEGGFCIAPDDVELYADKIAELLRDPELRRAQGEKGYQRYRQHFSAERMASDYAAAIRPS